jgi:membrane associated rhomboid family serine protease
MENSFNQRAEQQKLVRSILFPLFFVGILWFIWAVQVLFNVNLADTFGVIPRSFKGLIGIFTFPLIHANLAHLFSNTVPLLVLGPILFYFYRPIVFDIFFWVYIISGIWLWIAGRSDTCHIGASGLVYGFVSFLFFSGVFRWDKRLLILSLLTCFLYGSLVWGVLPIDPTISWEGHLLGSFSGIIIAFFYRKEGPQKQEFKWEDERDDEAVTDSEISDVETSSQQHSGITPCNLGTTCAS